MQYCLLCTCQRRKRHSAVRVVCLASMLTHMRCRHPDAEAHHLEAGQDWWRGLQRGHGDAEKLHHCTMFRAKLQVGRLGSMGRLSSYLR